jgi:GTPase SAR1 family protein
MSKKISVDDQHFAFQIWDTAGQEKVYITVMLGNESLNSGHGSSIQSTIVYNLLHNMSSNYHSLYTVHITA